MTGKSIVSASSCKLMKHKVEPVKYHSLLLIIGWTIIIQAILRKYYTFTHLNGSSGTNRFQMALRKMSFALYHILAQSVKLSKLNFPVTCVKNGQLSGLNLVHSDCKHWPTPTKSVSQSVRIPVKSP